MTLPAISWIAIAPELILALTAALVLLIDVQWKPDRRVLGYVAADGLVIALAFAVWQWFRVGELFNLPSTEQARLAAGVLPFAGMIVFDFATVFATVIILLVGLLAIAGGWRLFEGLGERAAEAIALVLLAAAGFITMAASAHLVMMFLGLEIGSISLYILAGYTRERPESDEAAIKYFLLGSFASAVFIYGAALVFAGTGSLFVFGERQFLGQFLLLKPAVLLIGIALLLVGLGFKVSAVPFHTWAPDVYQGAPAGVTGFMAAAAKIGGFAVIMRLLFSAFPSLRFDWAPVVAGLALASVVVGVVLAFVQDDVRRLLAYSSVAHAGFMLTGVTAGALAGPAIWFYLAAYSVQLVGAFVVVSAVSGAAGARAPLSEYAGLARRSPLLAGTFAVLLLGMSGLPLTTGFIAKFGVFRDAWIAGYGWLVVVGLLASVIGFAFYLKVIVDMYMRDPSADGPIVPPGMARTVLWLTAGATIVFGLYPQPIIELASKALPF